MKRLTKTQEEKIVTEIVFSHLDNVELMLRNSPRREKPAPLKAYFERYPGDFVYSTAERLFGEAEMENIRISHRAVERIKNASLQRVKSVFRNIGETHYPLFYEYIRQKSQNK